MAEDNEKSEARKARVARVMGAGPNCAHGGRLKCNQGCYSKGGEVKGVHGSLPESFPANKGKSFAGTQARAGHDVDKPFAKASLHGSAITEHRRVLGEMKSDKGKGDRRNLAEGGALEGMDSEPMDDMPDNDGDELLDSCADELMEAFEKKDKRGIVDALRALVLSFKE